jgi:phage shock protein A
MKLLQRVMMLIRANITDMLEQSEDPEHLLRQLQQDLRNQMMQVKTQVATAIAQEHKLQSRCEELTKEATQWQHKAEAAVARGDDAQARRALEQRLDTIRLLESYRRQHEEQQHLIVTMRSALKHLQAKTEETELTLELLHMRRRRAQMQQTVYETLAKNKPEQTQERGRQAEEQVVDEQPRQLPPPGAARSAALRRPPDAPTTPAEAQIIATPPALPSGERIPSRLSSLNEQVEEVLQQHQAKLGGSLKPAEETASEGKPDNQEQRRASKA